MRNLFLLAAGAAATGLLAISLVSIRSQSLQRQSRNDAGAATASAPAGMRPAKDDDDPLLADIVDIRGQTSGGLLQGTLLASAAPEEDKADFSEALRTVIDKRRHAARALQTRKLTDQPASEHPIMPVTPAGAISLDKPPSAVTAAYETLSLADTLRQAAREIDQAADDLDDRRQFERADTLRELSQSLRDHWRRLAD